MHPRQSMPVYVKVEYATCNPHLQYGHLSRMLLAGKPKRNTGSTSSQASRTVLARTRKMGLLIHPGLTVWTYLQG